MKNAILAIACLLSISLLTGCAGTGEGGRWTPQDTAAAVGIVNDGLNAYDHARATYYQQPYYAPAPGY